MKRQQVPALGRDCGTHAQALIAIMGVGYPRGDKIVPWTEARPGDLVRYKQWHVGVVVNPRRRTVESRWGLGGPAYRHHADDTPYGKPLRIEAAVRQGQRSPKPPAATVTHLSRYFKERTFGSESDAQRALIHVFRQGFDPMTRVQAEAAARAFPLYKLKKGWKIGRPVRNAARRFSWNRVSITPNSLEDLTTAGYVNAFDGPKLSRVKMVRLKDVKKTETGQDRGFIQSVAHALKTGDRDSFRAIVIEDGAIIDGHHRYEIAQLLRQRFVPAQEVTYYAELLRNWQGRA